MAVWNKILVVLALTIGLSFLATAPLAKTQPGQYKAEIAQAEKLGRIIYEKDIAAWVGTDKILEDLGNDVSGLPIRGWVTDKDGSRYRVNFIGEKDGETKIYYQAWTKGKKVKKSKTYKQGIELSGEQMSMWRARQLVSSQKFKQCSQIYNTVVVPFDDAGEEKQYVYLFASTTDPTKIVVDGHYRYTVSADGKKILSNIAFSNGCMEVTKDPKSVMFIVTHLKTNYPQEHHVFINLSHNMALMVGAAKADLMYMVNNGKIKETSEP